MSVHATGSHMGHSLQQSVRVHKLPRRHVGNGSRSIYDKLDSRGIGFFDGYLLVDVRLEKHKKRSNLLGQ